MEFKNKVFVVTGAGNGIGRQVALRLLEEEACVVAVDLSHEGLLETKALSGDNENLSIHTLNITNLAEVNNLPNKVLESFGRIDGLINIAGIIQPFINFSKMTLEGIERIINVNFYGTVYMIKAFLPHLENRTEKTLIVNTSSMGGFIPFPKQSVYGASKAAVKMLTEGLYAEYRGTNLQVNLVAPGAIGTNITKNSKVEISLSEDTDKQSAKVMSVEDCADTILKGIRKNKLNILVGKDARSMDKLYRLNPKRAINMVAKMFAKMFKD